MQRARAAENGPGPGQGREASASASRPTPLTLVAGAVAGDSLDTVAATVSAALSCPVAIAVPALGEPVVAPPGSLPEAAAASLVAHAAAVIAAEPAAVPAGLEDSVAVQIAEQVVGIVAAVRNGGGARSHDGMTGSERAAWLDAAAAAASVTALIREMHNADPGGTAADLLAGLAGGPPADLQLFLARGRRLGVDLSAGGVAICARASAGGEAPGEGEDGGEELIIARRDGSVLAIVSDERASRALIVRLRDEGLSPASAARRDPALLHEALLEAELLAELALDTLEAAGVQDTFRLLIGVLLHDRRELERLHGQTVLPLSRYDEAHDTELVVTLRAFLAHNGSTTETAEAMRLHRHTVGYRLARVHEVSGLSPYESGGRERLGLGIKALEILDAEQRLRECRRNKK